MSTTAATVPPILGEHALPNGRRYRITDTGAPYVPGEYPKGGIEIRSWDDRANPPRWLFIDYSPDEEAARGFLRMAASLQPLTPTETLSPVVELALCEVPHLFLRPNQLYRFTVRPGCPKCAKLAEPYAAAAEAPAA